MAEAMKQTKNKKEKNENNNTIKLDDFWEKRLATTITSKGEIRIKETIDNFCIILENLYKDKIFFNKLSKRVELTTKIGKNRPIETSDYDEIQRKIEKDFGIYDIKKTFSAIRTVAKKNSYHPVIEYLNSLKWDGINRIDTAFSTYLGANEENNEYNGMCLRLFLFGAIERVFNPGAKFDIMLIVNGTQGIGKSTFFEYMCGNHSEFFEENFNNFDKSFELTNGKWLVEISELEAFSKKDIKFLKGYITQKRETHRIPYQPEPEIYLRQFVLLGTTNETNFIPDDDSGDRRFIVVEAAGDNDKHRIKKNVWDEGVNYELQQVLAEVYEEYKNGKKFLQIPEKFKEQVSYKNKSHKIDDGIKGIIEGYLQDKKICCVQEIYQNAIKPLGIYNWSKSLSSKIADIIVRVNGWRRYTSSKDNRFYFKEFGKQIAFERYETEEEEEKRLKQEEQKKAEKLAMQKEHDNYMTNKVLNTQNFDYFKKIGD